MKVGLVLGAGGVVGGSWIVGALEALADETGWDPRTAERIVGTSAGSLVGALLATGMEPARMSAYMAGQATDAALDADARAVGLIERAARMRPHVGVPAVGPSSPGLVVKALLGRTMPSAAVAGVLPRGFISNEPLKDMVRQLAGDAWPGEGYRAVAADLGTGERVAFGCPDAPRPPLADAVAASCAIPGVYRPVEHDGRCYVDGGLVSMSNLDLLCEDDLDLVVCLNPTSSLEAVAGWWPGDHLGGLVRGMSGRTLGREAKCVRQRGIPVLLLQPDAEDVAGMGLNLMASGRRIEVLERARRRTAIALRDLRGDEGVLLPSRTRTRPARAPRPAPLRRVA